MKKQIFTTLMLGLLLLVVVAPNLNAQETNKEATKVDVYYFHSTKRCPTCEAIERETKKTLDNSFATQMADGTIKLHILNLEEKANKALVEKYEIAGSSLLLIPVSGGKVVDLTNKAFLYAKDNSFAFRKELKEKLNELLK